MHAEYKSDLDAGIAYEGAASIHLCKRKEGSDAIECYIKAFNIYKRIDAQSAMQAMTAAVEPFCVQGDFNRAVRQMDRLGEWLESESDKDESITDRSLVLQSYERAANLYEKSNMESYSNQPWLKVADLAALAGDYYKALDIYRMVSRRSRNGFLVAVGPKKYLFRVGTCYLATGDAVAAQHGLEELRGIDPDFASEKEYTQLHEFVGDLVAKDIDAWVKIEEQVCPGDGDINYWERRIISAAAGTVMDDDFMTA